VNVIRAFWVSGMPAFRMNSICGAPIAVME
jgi:hypothetical protein